MRDFWVLMQEATDGSEGGSGAGAAPDAAGSVLGAGAGVAEEYLPEKFRVTGEDGALDREASSRKLAEAYAGLEKRMGAGEVPPKSPDEYQIQVEKEGFDFEAFKADPQTQGFLKSAHAKGLTNDQVNFVISEYLQRADGIAQGAAEIDQQTALEQLGWGADKDKNVKLAYQAGLAAGLTPEQMASADVGNNVALLRVLAHFGAQMQEDLPPAGGAASGGADRESLIASEAYMNPNHPDHKRVYEQVARMTAQLVR